MTTDQRRELAGVVPIVPAPFTADEEIDFEAIRRCMAFAMRAGLKAVCLPAYASEFYKLTDAERRAVVNEAIGGSDGSVKVVAQANHPSARVAAQVAEMYEGLGASFISFALPRIFPLKEDDLLDYARTICRAVQLPVLIQDFNPGGPTVGGEFARRLADDCPNFRYLKLEESLMGPKIRGIIEATGGRIGVLEGWGGMYLMDLVPAGICGLMPGLGMADLLQRIWEQAKAGRVDEATELFRIVLPQIVYSLQHSEFFNWMEKRLLVARGVLPESSAHVRRATWAPDPATLEFGDRLNAQVVALARKLGMT